MGDVSSSHGDGNISLEFEDVISGVRFMSIDLSYEQFGKLIGTNGSVRMEAEILNAEKLGKKYVSEDRSIVCKEDFSSLKYADQMKAKQAWLAEHGKEDGWIVSTYLNSQKSIVSNYKDNTETFNYHVYKFVDISDEERAKILERRY